MRIIRLLLRDWFYSLLGFALLSVLVGGQFARIASLPWTSVFWIGARDWLPLAILTPFLFRLVARLPLEKERWKVALPAHLGACCAAAFFCVWWGEAVVPAQRIFQGVQRPGRPPEALRSHSDSPRPERPRGPGPRSRSHFIFGPGALQITLYLVLASAAHAVHFYRSSKERERRSLELVASLAQARLEALRMQLQPHFLFNSLNAIAALVHKDPDAADEMISALSDFLRLTLESSGEQQVPLRRELEFVERYLAIEKVRFGDRLLYNIDVEPSLLAAQVPTLILQPLVENAMRHGLEPLVAGGVLNISACEETGRLVITVQDNGKGLPPGGHREGVGLANARARLQELYGSQGGLKLTSTDGTTVTITLPFATVAP